VDINSNYDEYVKKIYSSKFLYLPAQNDTAANVYIRNGFINCNLAIPYLVHNVYKDDGKFKVLVSLIEITLIDKSYDDTYVFDYFTGNMINCSFMTAEYLKTQMLIPSDKIISIGVCTNKWKNFLRAFSFNKKNLNKYVHSENRVLSGYYINITDFDNPHMIEINGHNIIDLTTAVHHKFIKES
jgi:hypothetical protein